MKKTMITLAATFAAAVSMAAVTSQVVGYQHVPANEGWTMLCPTFQKLGGATRTLADITTDEVFADSFVYAWDSAGQQGESAWYYTGDEDYVAGWYDEEMNSMNDMPLLPGQALWAYSVAGGSIIASGQVQTEETLVQASEGWSMLGNPLPVALGLADVIPDEVFADSFIYFWDAAGQQGESAWYYTGDEDYVAGWYDEEMESMDATDLLPGQAFWAYSVAGGTLSFPGIAL